MSHLPVSMFQATSPPSLFVISYDLRAFGQDYPGLTNEIERIGGIRIQQSLFWVPSHHTAAALRDHLRSFMDGNDSLMVGQLGDVAGYEARPDVRAWIEVYLNLRHAA